MGLAWIGEVIVDLLMILVLAVMGSIFFMVPIVPVARGETILSFLI
jgi:hypothetical protein